MRIALAQINCTVGDLEGNCEKIRRYTAKAIQAGADLIAFPELAITGYPPEDLLLKPQFIADNIRLIKELAHSTRDIVAVVGYVEKKGGALFNAAGVIKGGRIISTYQKMLLPNYGVFDELRYFSAGKRALTYSLGDCLLGVTICEDIWNTSGPVKKLAAKGAGLIININASPYHMGKISQRQQIVCAQAKAHRLFFAYCNLVGGQDELVFDGQSLVADSRGDVIAQAAAFKEELLVVDINVPSVSGRTRGAVVLGQISDVVRKTELSHSKAAPLEITQEVYAALTLGLQDYVIKNGFHKVVIGLSGGVDSALVAALAVDALGSSNVTGIFMPSRYSSDDSAQDARELAQRLNICFHNITIEQVYKMYLLLFEPHFAGLPRDIAEENIQARIRGNILMGFSNKFGWLVLTTGNKSEMSTGYATLYGDMAGGLAVIKDVPKTLVYTLCRYRNTISAAIPERILTKAPTAELRLNQKDSDSLPVYETLDPILKKYVEEDLGAREIIAAGFSPADVAKTMKLVDGSEYKRRQAPPGIKITPKAFGRDRRLPITNKYRG